MEMEKEMTRIGAKKILKTYAGKKFYVLATRQGGMFKPIHKLNKYIVTHGGGVKCFETVIGLVANKSQYRQLDDITRGNYISGRPTTIGIANKVERGDNFLL